MKNVDFRINLVVNAFIFLTLMLLPINMSMAQSPSITTTPENTVAYNNEYHYHIFATEENNLETTITPVTLPDWLIYNSEGQSAATQHGDVPSGVKLSGVTGDNKGNIYTITSDGTTIYKIAPNGVTTLWRDDLIEGSVYDLHISNGYIYIPRYYENTNSITRVPLDNLSGLEEVFASITGGAICLTDNEGWIYAVNTVQEEIVRINETSNVKETVITSANGIKSPWSVVFDDLNNLYVTSMNEAYINMMVVILQQF